jgi:hypothetical protein
MKDTQIQIEGTPSKSSLIPFNPKLMSFGLKGMEGARICAEIRGISVESNKISVEIH